MTAQQNQADHPAGPTEAVRPLLWWSASELAAIRQHLAASLAEFGLAWGLDVAVVAIANAGEADCPSMPPSPHGWTALSGAADEPADMWLACEEHPPVALRHAMFGVEDRQAWHLGYAKGDMMADDVAADAWQSLRTALVAASPAPAPALSGATPGSQSHPDQQCKPWCGAIRAKIRVRGAAIVKAGLHIGPDWASRCVGARRERIPKISEGGLTPMLDALRRQPLTLIARLADVELDLASLLSLQPGDVITIPHALHQPVALSVQREDGTSGPDAALAFLGAMQQAKAVEMLAPNVGAPQRPSDRTSPVHH